jgi:oxygen-independent coproporphyrinogen-3 oxidase
MTCAIRDNILKFDRQVPRYTSYPTAPHFRPLQSKQTYLDWLGAVPQGEAISLYFHVPFCSKLCWYCGCHTKITQRYAPVEDYVHLLLREIDILSEHLPNKVSVQNIHFGGGSPGMIRACDFERIMQRLTRRFDVLDDAQIAIEIDPRGVSEGRAATYAKYGVNRISLGVQDFDDQVLASVNRQQPFHLSYDAVSLFRQYGIEQINMDLLYGLPHQTLESMSGTIEKVLLLNPDRISLFGYAHVPWMKKHMRLIDENMLPQKDLRFDLFNLASDLLKQAGYVAIGIDHFAKPDDMLVVAARDKTLKRNFQGYTFDQCRTMIGLGASSIGALAQGYVQNAVDMPGYKNAILASELPAQKICAFTDEDIVRAQVIEELMCYHSVDLGKITQRFELAEGHFDDAIERLEPYKAAGMVDISGDLVIQISDDARQITRLVAAAFDAYLDDKASTVQRHAKAI